MLGELTKCDNHLFFCL